jgi:hypothetical protein
MACVIVRVSPEHAVLHTRNCFLHVGLETNVLYPYKTTGTITVWKALANMDNSVCVY